MVQYFAEDKNKPTIETLDPSAQDVIGNRDGLSFRDIKTVNLMYDCKPRKFSFNFRFLVPLPHAWLHSL